VNRNLLERRLDRLGYSVVSCNDGREVLPALTNGNIDLVLLDLLMPGIDGYEVLNQMKADPTLRHIPVIIISAMDRLEGIVRCIEIGAEDYLPKPFEPVLLRARIGAALEKKRLRDWEQIYLQQIEDERKKSDQLLLNILPRAIADRLKQGEKLIVDSFPEVTVMFADLVGFTTLSLHIAPSLVVRLLDEIFSLFDDLAVRHGLEKIKTIGDAYMAVAGLPFPRADHAEAVARMALEMQAAIEKFNQRHRISLQMRIGINTGPVIAGIIGHNKFSYDLWGDTVNTASRMESHGEPGGIQVTEATAQRLQRGFVLKNRGLVEIKGRPSVVTWWLTGLSA
jgi:class 3 adenylate cyclase/CheY-like chemotaxis protein